MKLLIASHNQGKLKEFAYLFKDQAIDLCTLDSSIIAPEETADTFSGNALIKAQYGCEQTGLITLADDSGFEITALDNAPGVYSARWAAGNYTNAFQKIQKLLGANWRTCSAARFQCVLCLYFPSGKYEFFTGTCEGNLTFPPRGNNGFGYDSIFIAKGQQQTFGEMLQEQKAQYSHRNQALAKLQAYLAQNPLKN